MKKLILFLSLASLAFTQPEPTVDELKNEIIEAMPDIWGWCSTEKINNFFDLVIEAKPKVCVEIGVYAGASFLPVAVALNYLNDGVLVGIDPWDTIESIRYYDLDKHKAHIKFWTTINPDQIYFMCQQLIKRFELEKNCVIIRATSKKAALMIGDIDILHIDGNHHEIPFSEDILTYLPKVRAGGYVWINSASWKSIQPINDLLTKSCDIVKSIDNGNCTLFKKR